MSYREIGIILIDLASLLSAPCLPQLNSLSTQAVDVHANIVTYATVNNNNNNTNNNINSNDNVQKAEVVGSVRAVITLEDFGESKNAPKYAARYNNVIANAEHNTNKNNNVIANAEDNTNKNNNNNDNNNKTDNKNAKTKPILEAKRKADFELELWRHQEEMKWKRSMKEKEKKRAAELEEKWKQKELERMTIYAKYVFVRVCAHVYMCICVFVCVHVSTRVGVYCCIYLSTYLCVMCMGADDK